MALPPLDTAARFPGATLGFGRSMTIGTEAALLWVNMPLPRAFGPALVIPCLLYASVALPQANEAPAQASPAPTVELGPGSTPEPPAPAKHVPPASGYSTPITPGYTYVPPIQLEVPPPFAPSGQGEPTPQARERTENAHVDRVILMPTAETHPRGTLFFSSYEIILLQAGYALSDETQISLTLTPPVGKDNVVPLDVTLKTVVLRQPHVRLAAYGSASGVAGLKEGTALLGRVGATFQGCFALTCGSSVSVASTLLLLGPALISANGVGMILKVSDTVDWLFEVDSLVPLGREAGIYNGISGGTGVRLSGKQLGLDITLLVPLDQTAKGIPVVPFLAGTYRENLLD